MFRLVLFSVLLILLILTNSGCNWQYRNKLTLCNIWWGKREIIGGERASLYIEGWGIYAAEGCACMPVLQGISNCTASSCGYWTMVQTREVMCPLSPAKVSCGTAYVAMQPNRIPQSSMHQVTRWLTSCSSFATQDLGVWASPPMFFLPPSIIIFLPPTCEILRILTCMNYSSSI